MYRFDAEDPGQSLYTPTTVGVIGCTYIHFTYMTVGGEKGMKCFAVSSNIYMYMFHSVWLLP